MGNSSTTPCPKFLEIVFKVSGSLFPRAGLGLNREPVRHSGWHDHGRLGGLGKVRFFAVSQRLLQIRHMILPKRTIEIFEDAGGDGHLAVAGTKLGVESRQDLSFLGFRNAREIDHGES